MGRQKVPETTVRQAFLRREPATNRSRAAEQPHELDTGGQMQCELVHARARVRVRPCECPVLLAKTGETLWRHREKAILAPSAAQTKFCFMRTVLRNWRIGEALLQNCGGSGVKIGCPNFRAHRLWPLIRKRVVPQCSAERAKPPVNFRLYRGERKL